MNSPRFEDAVQEPARIGRYTLRAKLGSGGSADVYLAESTGQGGFRRLVAIKTVHKHLLFEEEFVNMLLDEARIAGSIRHPNVVGIHEVHADPRSCYLVMDYIDGLTLSAMVASAEERDAMLPFGASIAIMLDALAGLQWAHDLCGDDGTPLHVVHRDVSPANILVGRDGTTRVSDFGIARAATRLTITQPGVVKGRFTYMAPEQGLADAVDRRADVYSAGAVLWELLAGSRLTVRESLSPAAFLMPAPDVRERNPRVSPMLAAVVKKALEVNPERRWESAAEFAHYLEVAAKAEVQIATRPEISELVGNLRERMDASGERPRARRVMTPSHIVPPSTRPPAPPPFAPPPMPIAPPVDVPTLDDDWGDEPTVRTKVPLVPRRVLYIAIGVLVATALFFIVLGYLLRSLHG